MRFKVARKRKMHSIDNTGKELYITATYVPNWERRAVISLEVPEGLIFGMPANKNGGVAYVGKKDAHS